MKKIWCKKAQKLMNLMLQGKKYGLGYNYKNKNKISKLIQKN